MIFLILAILSSSTIGVVMRLGSQKVKSKLGMLSVNYMACAVLAGGYCMFSGGLLPRHEMLGSALWLGSLCGVLFLCSFMLLQWNTVKNGVVLSSVFMKLGVMVPTLMSVLFFGVKPAAVQVVGFILALAAIVLMNMEKGNTAAKSAVGLLVLLFSGGLSDSMSLVYDRLGSPDLSDQYLLYIFVVAMVLCVALMLFQKQGIGLGELLYGAVLGIPNFFSAKFLLAAVSAVSPVVAYPTFSVGTIVVTSLCGVLLFKEKLSKQQLIGMAVILAALVLLNI